MHFWVSFSAPFSGRFLASFRAPFGTLSGSVMGSFLVLFRVGLSGAFSVDFGRRSGSVSAFISFRKSTLGPPGGEKADL